MGPQGDQYSTHGPLFGTTHPGLLVGHTERPHWEMVFTLYRLLVDQNLMLKTMVSIDFFKMVPKIP